MNKTLKGPSGTFFENENTVEPTLASLSLISFPFSKKVPDGPFNSKAKIFRRKVDKIKIKDLTWRREQKVSGEHCW